MLDLLASLCLHPKRTVVALGLLLAMGLWKREARWGRIALRGAFALGLALAVFLPSALAFRGSARTALLARIKRSQADEGRLHLAPRWGLVDRSHVDATREHVRIARAHLRDPATRQLPLRLVSEGGTLAGAAWSTVHVYRLVQPDRLDPAQIDDAARAIALQAAFDLEVEQERAPWSTGLRLTAWQLEDLPSALYAVGCDPNEATTPALAYFDAAAPDFANTLVRTLAAPAELTPAEQAQLQRIRAAGQLWTADFSEPMSWADVPLGDRS